MTWTPVLPQPDKTCRVLYRGSTSRKRSRLAGCTGSPRRHNADGGLSAELPLRLGQVAPPQAAFLGEHRHDPVAAVARRIRRWKVVVSHPHASGRHSFKYEMTASLPSLPSSNKTLRRIHNRNKHWNTLSTRFLYTSLSVSSASVGRISLLPVSDSPFSRHRTSFPLPFAVTGIASLHMLASKDASNLRL